ncbi:MAG TPA: acetamidase/formamidase family protein [Candidatus Latescibacteria bacterium]|jgi:acetamidase/formamidase|nr:acetamidase [Gemmatimonadaceae bacterium]MDP6016626.1 acetamidase/formamidase family protein [Candidatus Latescibacterota bacterium]HJP31547.1 acetamidase/formamidase family protein [Candidatus Latescibacterota bacterium]
MAHHEFTPTHYHNTLGWHDPVLEIDPGDTVVTTTVDARGQDHAGERVAQRGNPQTGPFYVRGAEPGDALVVTLDELTPNRSWGFTGCEVAPNVLDPGYRPTFDDDLANCPTFDGAPFFRWAVDVEAGTVHLAEPEGPLSGLQLTLDPMVGCFGVAPPGRQAISTATSSTHGGNMDYRGFRQGTKVYFPVSAPGALFHIGDGHAVQGDGEIVGTGVEISFSVRFTVDVVKDSSARWPRAEDADWLMTVGNARPLDQCVQHATTEMLGWLQSDHGLSARAAHQLLGQTVAYDLGNIFDPAYTMVCKIRKEHVQALR